MLYEVITGDTKISSNADFPFIGVDSKAHRSHSIVGYRKAMDFDIPDKKIRSPVKFLDGRQVPDIV